jgi:hypothetical protein
MRHLHESTVLRQLAAGPKFSKLNRRVTPSHKPLRSTDPNPPDHEAGIGDLSPETLRVLERGQEKLLADRREAGIPIDPRCYEHLQQVREALERA